MNNDLISRSALKKEVENLVVGGEKGLKDYYKNGSISDQNAWIGGVYDAWELINDAPTVEDHSLEIAKKSIELGRSVGQLEGKNERPQQIVVIEPELIKKVADALVEAIGQIDWNLLVNNYIEMQKEERGNNDAND